MRYLLLASEDIILLHSNELVRRVVDHSAQWPCVFASIVCYAINSPIKHSRLDVEKGKIYRLFVLDQGGYLLDGNSLESVKLDRELIAAADSRRSVYYNGFICLNKTNRLKLSIKDLFVDAG